LSCPDARIGRPELVAPTPEDLVRNGCRDPVDHHAYRALQRGEPLSEKVDELDQDRRLSDAPEWPVRHSQRPQILDPSSARGTRLVEPLDPRDEHAE
jgi:hypothetical protein